MRQRILGLMGGKRRRRFLLGVVASTTVLGALLVSNALAVHDFVFQLDGDVDPATTTNVGGTAQNLDWSDFFNADGSSKALPSGFTASSFDRDFLTKANGSFDTSDTSIFTTGSKDTLPITPGWQCKSANNVLSKDDIMNAYSTAYTAADGDEILYFAMEKNANEGNNNVGFWFLQDAADCSATGGTTSFTGDHQDGDLLIVSAFTNGGTVSTIDVYRWTGGANGSLGTTPIAHGADCGTTPAPPSDDACATVNAPNDGINGTITTPWPTANKDDGVGNSLRTAEFFEGGVNLTNHNLGGKCFNTFLADTRSSQSLTATLFDFSRGQLGSCLATMSTQVSDAGPVLPGVAVHDTATVTGNKALITPTGDVTFFLCGPIATGACTSGGTLVGTGTLSGTGATATATSPDVNVSPSLSPGRYCFRAEWPGDLNYTNPLTESGGPNGTNECFTVKDTSSITTAQKWLPQDTATVTTAGGTPVSGSVVFSLYENGTCSGTPARTFGPDTSAPFETNNETYYTSSQTISWSATFTPTNPDAVQGSTTTRCERSDLTINNDAGPFPPTP
jgi:hypothetical protein